MKAPSALARATLVCSSLLAGLASAAETKVKPGQSIQVAINNANPGDTVTVAKGTYHEQLLIAQKGIQLVGQAGAVLKPPPAPATNGCSGLAGDGTQAGICVLGSNVQLGDVENGEHRTFLSVGTPVADVLVKGLTVQGFTGLNIAVVGAQNAVVRENTVLDGTHYGILTVGSVNTLITRNTVDSAARSFIGICMDDQSDVQVTVNSITDYSVGLCVQTNKAVVSHNTVVNCCVGVYVDPAIDGAHVTQNHIAATQDPACVAPGGLGLSAGVIIDSATNTDVQHNDISGQGDGWPAILILDTSAVASGSVVDFNSLSNNDYNIYLATSGTQEIKHNTCVNPATNCNY